MKKVGALFVALCACALPALAEQFLSVSDIHFNPFADPTLVTKLEGAEVSEWDAIFASSAVKGFSAVGSDINDALFKSALAEMQRRIPSPEFVLISGDFLAHKFDKLYQQYATDKSHDAYSAFVTKTIAYVASQFRKSFPDVRIYPTLGNNDSDCGDYAVAPNGAFLQNFRDVWAPIVASRSFARRFPTGGYYRADVPSLANVRIIALNANFFSVNYQNPCGTPGGDPGLQELAWLEGELLLARAEHKRVWLLFHIPPGIDVYDTVEKGTCPGVNTQTFWKDEYEQKYLRITAAHRKTIIGTFAGHTHQDEFRIATGDFIHITPSISPIFGNNPAFEIVSVSLDGEIADYTAFHLPAVALPWSPEYAFGDAYDKVRYDTKSLTEIAAAIESDNATRETYFTYSASGAAKTAADALTHWKGYWCGFTTMTASAFAKCYCAN